MFKNQLVHIYCNEIEIEYFKVFYFNNNKY